MTRITTSARFVAGAVIAAATVAAVGGGVLFDWMPHTAAPASVSVAPAAADAVLTCGGPLLAIGRDAKAASGIAVAADQSVTAAADAAQDVLQMDGISGEGPLRLTAPAEGRTVPMVAAAGSATVSASDLSGFSAAACAPALMESWLVGGSTTTGASDLVLLANPGSVAATVDLTFYGADGATHPGAGSHLVVAPGTEQVLPLAGLGLGVEAPVVRVSATGAPVRAALQSSITRGLTPGGVAQQGAIAAAATTQVITGVRVTAAPGDEPTSTVRLLAAAGTTEASITVLGAHGATGPAMQVPLKADGPVEATLDGLAPGVYTVVVTADKPVVAAAWQATGTGSGDDFAWVNAAPALSAGDTLFAVPDGPGAQLAVTPAGSEPVQVTITPSSGGSGTTVTVAPGETTTIPVGADAGYTLTADGAVHAAVTFAGKAALAAFPIWPQDAASAPVVVYPR
ncbi:DUF5719 family protein [Microbacterium luticocti]|uniref:DUF5719 family protein n=1 Tax=Microbacterium luticocti TaxID=451764 RepID=UPI00042855AD|nr:DUF5719 family protein [Microbacterium luticocti]